MAPDPAATSESCMPAPYGRACISCSRSKCKCFYRSDGPGCERCHRLGKQCETAPNIRKRKARTGPYQQVELPVGQPSTPSPPSQQPSSKIEDKLDELVSLLRARTVDEQGGSSQQPSISSGTPSSASVVRAPIVFGGPAPKCNADVSLDTETGVLRMFPPEGDESPVHGDISVHDMPAMQAEEQLDVFRRAFIPEFPFVHIATTTTAVELRRQKPFLWLNIMALTSKAADVQFAMERTIWEIISHRIVCEHLTDMDLLLGLICFASWSLHFKQDRGFMGMLAHSAIAIAEELGLNGEVTVAPEGGSPRGLLSHHLAPPQQARTFEERRAVLSLFHITSTAWASYRKTKPISWTKYLDNCLKILGDSGDSPMDGLLVAQVRCHAIANHLTCPMGEGFADGDANKPLPLAAVTSFQTQLEEIRHGLPVHVRSQTSAKFHLLSTELRILEAFISRPRAQDLTGHAQLRRIQELDSTLTCIERWIATFFEMPPIEWLGFSVINFSQFTHCLVVLFKITTLEEKGWDLAEVKRRADVFDILDRVCVLLNQIPQTLGLRDASGPRRGLFFKSEPLFQAMKKFLMAEITQKGPVAMLPSPESDEAANAATQLGAEALAADPYFMAMSDEPWVADVMSFSWDVPFEDHMNISFNQF